MFTIKYFGACIIICTILLGAITLSYAGSTKLINYQGTLTDQNGNVLISAPGTTTPHNATFSMYSSMTGGTPTTALWTESWKDTTPLVVASDGTCNVMLGAHTAFPASFFADHPTTYLGIQIDADAEMLPRQRISSVAYALSAANGVPKGCIVMWSGSSSSIPDGWALCDGLNGTPNLKDKFVLGAGDIYAVGSSGGNATINLQHSHTVNNHTHTMSHTHTYSGTTGWNNDSSDRTKDTKLYGTAANPHNHTYSGTTSDSSNGNTGWAAPGTDNQLSQAQSILPPYYALVFIMKL